MCIWPQVIIELLHFVQPTGVGPKKATPWTLLGWNLVESCVCGWYPFAVGWHPSGFGSHAQSADQIPIDLNKILSLWITSKWIWMTSWVSKWHPWAFGWRHEPLDDILVQFYHILSLEMTSQWMWIRSWDCRWHSCAFGWSLESVDYILSLLITCLWIWMTSLVCRWNPCAFGCDKTACSCDPETQDVSQMHGDVICRLTMSCTFQIHRDVIQRLRMQSTDSQCNLNLLGCPPDSQSADLIQMHGHVICRLRISSKWIEISSAHSWRYCSTLGILFRDWECDSNPHEWDTDTQGVIQIHSDIRKRFVVWSGMSPGHSGCDAIAEGCHVVS